MIKLMREGRRVVVDDVEAYYNIITMLETLSNDLGQGINDLLFHSGYDIVAGD